MTYRRLVSECFVSGVEGEGEHVVYLEDDCSSIGAFENTLFAAQFGCC